jgi:hypothetical protein
VSHRMGPVPLLSSVQSLFHVCCSWLPTTREQCIRPQVRKTQNLELLSQDSEPARGADVGLPFQGPGAHRDFSEPGFETELGKEVGCRKKVIFPLHACLLSN